MASRSMGSVVLLSALLAACAGPPVAQHVGDSKRTALEVCRPQGERAYLSRLGCADGSAVTFRRSGNVGFRNDLTNGGPDITSDPFARLAPGVADWHIVDAYEVSCGPTKRTVYLDMYHCDQPLPTDAPEGFTLRGAKS